LRQMSLDFSQQEVLQMLRPSLPQDPQV